MNASRKTTRDRFMIALVVIPPITLMLFCVSAAAKWQIDKSKIRPMLEQTVSSELINAPSPIGASFEARVSDENTESYRDLIAAVDVLNDRYSIMFDALDDQDDWADDREVERPIDKHVRDYLDLAAPYLKLISELKPNPSEIWTPYESGNPNRGTNALISNRGISDLLRLEFRSAVKEKETERAIESFNLFCSLGGGTNTLDSNQMLPLVVDSLKTEIWSESDLQSIDQLIVDSPNVAEEWSRHVETSILEHTPWLLEGKVTRSWRPDPVPRTYAPSRRIEWLENTKRYKSVNGIGSRRSVEKVLKIESESTTLSSSQIDTAIQLPWYGNYYDGGTSRSYFAKMYVKAVNDRKFVRTAIAIARYKIKFDTYPESLNELSKVGLPRSATIDPIRRPFRYESDGDTCKLANASIWFPVRLGSHNSFQSSQDTLGTLLQEHKEITFGNERSTDQE